MKPLTLPVLLILATATQAEDAPRYSAQETIRRAQVGTSSPRLAPPVQVRVPAGKPDPSRYDRRMVCRIDPSKPLGKDLICETKK